MSGVRRRPHGAARATMRLEELDNWIARLNPAPLIDGISMLDGYLAAIIVGPCSIDPHEWLRHMLGPHGRIGSEGSGQAAAIGTIVARFNAISEGLTLAPERYAPIFERTDAGTVLAGPWCMGFVAAMNLRLDAWRPLCDLGRVEHACSCRFCSIAPMMPGSRCLGRCGRGLRARSSCEPPITTSRSWCRQSASSGCRSAPEPEPTRGGGGLAAHTIVAWHKNSEASQRLGS
jgi:uncharacterized protein